MHVEVRQNDVNDVWNTQLILQMDERMETVVRNILKSWWVFERGDKNLQSGVSPTYRTRDFCFMTDAKNRKGDSRGCTPEKRVSKPEKSDRKIKPQCLQAGRTKIVF